MPAVSSTKERERTISTIVAAFINDPVVRWALPDVHQYISVFPSFADAFGGRAFEYGSAREVSDHAAVALWLPPGIEPDGESMGRIIEESARPELLDDLFGFVEKQEEMHPSEAHWYLPLMGVDPVRQGQGLGSALLSDAAAMADEARIGCYLEATSASNRRLYERHGFVVTGEIQHGSSPVMYGMWREPR